MHTANIILTLLTGLVATDPDPNEADAPGKETGLAPGVNSGPMPSDRADRQVPNDTNAVPVMSQIRTPHDYPKILSPVILSSH